MIWNCPSTFKCDLGMTDTCMCSVGISLISVHVAWIKLDSECCVEVIDQKV